MRNLFPILFLLLICGCGVKGKPQPPSAPTPIGRGYPNFNKATENIKIKKSSKRPIKDDWEDPKEEIEGLNK